MTTTTVSTAPDVRAAADGWRALAGFVEANPDMFDLFRYSGLLGGPSHHFNVTVPGNPDARANMGRYIVAARAVGAEVRDWSDSVHAGVEITLGRITLHVYCSKSWLADEPLPPPGPYRPLLADESTGGAR